MDPQIVITTVVFSVLLFYLFDFYKNSRSNRRKRRAELEETLKSNLHKVRTKKRGKK